MKRRGQHSAEPESAKTEAQRVHVARMGREEAPGDGSPKSGDVSNSSDLDPQKPKQGPVHNTARHTSAAWVKEARRVQQYLCIDGMTICIQPAGIVTDYLLTAVSLALAAILFAHSPSAPAGFANKETGTAAWHIGFLLATAVSSLLGGAVHHYCLYLTRLIDSGKLEPGDVDMWIVVAWRIVMGVGSVPNFCLYAVAVWLVADDDLAWGLTAGGAVLYTSVALLVGYTRKIIVHVAFSVPTILFYLGSALYRVSDSASARWNVGAAAGLMAAGAVVALKPAISKEHFNHNALMHCVLLVVCGCAFGSAYQELIDPSSRCSTA